MELFDAAQAWVMLHTYAQVCGAGCSYGRLWEKTTYNEKIVSIGACKEICFGFGLDVVGPREEGQQHRNR